MTHCDPKPQPELWTLQLAEHLHIWMLVKLARSQASAQQIVGAAAECRDRLRWSNGAWLLPSQSPWRCRGVVDIGHWRTQLNIFSL